MTTALWSCITTAAPRPENRQRRSHFLGARPPIRAQRRGALPINLSAASQLRHRLPGGLSYYTRQNRGATLQAVGALPGGEAKKCAPPVRNPGPFACNLTPRHHRALQGLAGDCIAPVAPHPKSVTDAMQLRRMRTVIH